MGKKNESQYGLRDFEIASHGSRETRSYGRVTNSMMRTEVWKALTPTARLVYLYLKSLYRYSKHRATECRTVTSTDKQIAEGAGLGVNSVVRGLRQLEELGFIECKEKGVRKRTASVYEFSTHWIIVNAGLVRERGLEQAKNRIATQNGGLKTD
jgi:predicted transcriptional regulator with HTH domain